MNCNICAKKPVHEVSITCGHNTCAVCLHTQNLQHQDRHCLICEKKIKAVIPQRERWETQPDEEATRLIDELVRWADNSTDSDDEEEDEPTTLVSAQALGDGLLLIEPSEVDMDTIKRILSWVKPVEVGIKVSLLSNGVVNIGGTPTTKTAKQLMAEGKRIVRLA